LSLFGSASLPAQIAWVNEIHYDNVGGDVGEFVEVFVASGIDAADITFTLYNGGDTFADASFTIDTFTQGASTGSGTLYSELISGIQNGSPDGWSLSGSGLTTQFFSYEGTFTGGDGPANGLLSIDIGVSETTRFNLG